MLDRNAWLFEDTSDEQNLEGWQAAPDDQYGELELNTREAALALEITGSDAGLLSPDWTDVPTDEFDQLVLRTRSHDGDHEKAIFWRGADEEFSGERAVSFEAPGDGDFHDMVIPIGEHEAWSGDVDRLRIDPLEEDPADGGSNWYDLAAIFFQNSKDETTSAPGVEYVDTAPAELVEPDDEEDEGNDGDGGDEGDEDDGTKDDDSEEDEQGDETADDEREADEKVSVNDGCAAGGDGPAAAGVVWWLVAAACARRLWRSTGRVSRLRS